MASENEKDKYVKILHSLDDNSLKEHYREVLRELNTRRFPPPSKEVLELLEFSEALAVVRYRKDNPTATQVEAERVVQKYRK